MNSKITNKFGILGIFLIALSITLGVLITSSLGFFNLLLRFIFTLGSTWFFIWTGKTLSHILGMTYNYELAVVVSAIAFLVGITCEIICGVYIEHTFNACSFIALISAVTIYLKVLHLNLVVVESY